MSPATVSENGVVGQATSFDLTLTGGSPYTYTQTFGNICDVSINNDTATVTITPTTSGTLTGSITFDSQATCNITIDVSEPQPTVGLQPSTVIYTMNAQESWGTVFTLLEFDSDTEEVSYSFESSIEDTVLSIGEDTPSYNPYGYELTMESSNQTGQAVVGNVYVKAKIYDLESQELLRTYTATIHLTIQALDD